MLKTISVFIGGESTIFPTASFVPVQETEVILDHVLDENTLVSMKKKENAPLVGIDAIKKLFPDL